jgi:hypothetical protein
MLAKLQYNQRHCGRIAVNLNQNCGKPDRDVYKIVDSAKIKCLKTFLIQPCDGGKEGWMRTYDTWRQVYLSEVNIQAAILLPMQFYSVLMNNAIIFR